MAARDLDDGADDLRGSDPDRPGDNLYTNSIVALDVRTGALRWYDQMVPADDHDWDLTQASPIFRTRSCGVERNMVATVGKDGLLRVLDRDTHERLYEAEVTTRTNVDAPVTKEGSHACPGILGGVEWNGPAFHPGENLVITPAGDHCYTFFAAEDVRCIQGEVNLGGHVEADPESWSGWVTAVDASDGSLRWRYRLQSPVVAAVTTTAGGLALTGELTGDFLVLDVASVTPLHRFNTGGPIGGVSSLTEWTAGSTWPSPRVARRDSGTGTIRGRPRWSSLPFRGSMEINTTPFGPRPDRIGA